ncbi:YodC family protein [Stappia indica]|uniref:YodC family protein n=1 Tax=Stappia indica TaxID=538381 RepID=UPI001D182890|nr:DUF2158 domain-containing protein [Stappia indica]MCC4243393.1 DUF2158 domain-containing protein [Stappia indica]
MKNDTNHVDVTTPPRFLVCEGAETKALIDGPGDTHTHAITVARHLQQTATLGITLWREAGRFPAPSQQETDAPSSEPQTCAEAAARCPFQVGDVVRLKSESRSMTVVWVESGRDAECGWFDRYGEFHSQDFPIVALTKAERDDEQPF